MFKYYTVQVTNLYTDASDSQDNHTEVDNIIQMEMTPKIITIRYIIKRYKTLATLKFSTSAYRVVVAPSRRRASTCHSRSRKDDLLQQRAGDISATSHDS